METNTTVPDIDCTVEGALARVTINRPGARNAMTLAMWKGMAVLFNELGGNAEVRTIILSGSGDDFSVGADVSEFSKVRNDAE
ncbi:MAG TPA: enoyl-CoA hydratase/isomerase family protein, partial [Promineifilum sp.]|nr:enoyl-CoA hydratase/isomerase family protein [Promineifilum sp.]